MSKWRKFPSVSAYVLALAGAAFLAGNAKADFVINDDAIVIGSLCVGFDCVNNENFGFDTIRLKENNLRIMFVDTSTAIGFPSRDWQLVANQSTSGGQNYFGIRDCGTANPGGASECGTRTFGVAGGAPADSLFVSSAGRVGIRTAAPVLDLHVRTGNTPAHRLEQDGSSGFSPQTWDIAGNESNFFVRDATGGSTLPFRIRPGAPSSSILIATGGNVGIGTASPTSGLTVANSRLQVTGDGTPSGGAGVEIGHRAAQTEGILTAFNRGTSTFLSMRYNSLQHVFQTSNSNTMALAGGNVGIGTTAPAARLHTIDGVRFAGVANCTNGIQSNAAGDLSCLVSSRRFKLVESELAPQVALANVMALRPYVGAYKETPDEPEHWLIAEEVAEVDRALVGLADGEPYTVKTQGVVADLVAVIQQQQRRIEALEQALAR